MYYVYRFLNKNNKVIYIGKTQGKIGNRLGIHFGVSGHLPKDCYNSTKTIEYIELYTKLDMDIKELYYIGKWKPLYNADYNRKNEKMRTILEEDNEWIVFKDDISKYASREKKMPSKPFTEDSLKPIIDTINCFTLTGKRDKSIMLLGFYTFSRRSELSLIDYDNIEFTTDGANILMFNSMTKLFTIKTIKYTYDNYCPVASLKDWLNHSRIKGSSIFRTISKSNNIGERLDGRTIATIVKKYVQLAGLDPKLYSADSLRSYLPHGKYSNIV